MKFILLHNIRHCRNNLRLLILYFRKKRLSIYLNFESTKRSTQDKLVKRIRFNYLLISYKITKYVVSESFVINCIMLSFRKR